MLTEKSSCSIAGVVDANETREEVNTYPVLDGGQHVDGSPMQGKLFAGSPCAALYGSLLRPISNERLHCKQCQQFYMPYALLQVQEVANILWRLVNAEDSGA